MNKIYKNSGVRYWKDSFIDLKPFDEMNLGEVLTRYKNILEGFKEYQPDNGAFFVPIKRTSDLNIPEVKRIHEKFNSKTCIVDDNKKAKKILFSYGKSPYKRDFYGKGSPDGTINSHQQWKDGYVRPGIECINDFVPHIESMANGRTNNRFVYLEIPHSILRNYMILNHNEYNMDIAKKFVEELEVDNKWENSDYVNELIDVYDEKYPDWNYDFPVYGYCSVRQIGFLNPGFYFGHKIFHNGTHRVFMCGLSKSDFPLILQVPLSQRDEPNKFDKCIIGESEWVVFTPPFFEKIGKKFSRLLIKINLEDRNLIFYLTDEFWWNNKHFHDVNKKCIGESKF
jgi:hypothetical protein